MEYTVGKYTFTDEETAKKARKEADTITFIRNRSDLSKPENITKIINTIVDNKMFETEVGLDFLEELKELEKRGEVYPKASPENTSKSADNAGENASDGEISSEASDFAPADEEVIRAEVIRRTKHLKESAEERVEKIRELYRDKARNLRITIFALIAVIIGLLVLTFFSDNSPLVNAEEKILDKYSAWEEQLNLKEQELTTWELELKERENALK